MIIEPVRGLVVCEIVPVEDMDKKYVRFPQEIGEMKMAVLKALIDPSSKEIVKTDHVKFGVKKGKEKYVCMSEEAFEILCDLYLSESYWKKFNRDESVYENIYAIFEFPQKIWAYSLGRKRAVFPRRIDEDVIEVLKGLEYV